MKQIERLFRNLSISIKLNIVLAVVFSVLILSSTVIAGATIRQIGLTSSEQRMEQEMALVRSRLDESAEQMLTQARLYASLQQIPQAIISGDRQGAVMALVGVGVSTHRFSIEVYGLEGQAIARLGSGAGLSAEARQALAREATAPGQEIVTTVFDTDGDSPRAWLAAAVPVRDAERSIVGALLLSRPLDREFLRAIDATRDDVHLMLIREGQIVAHDLPMLAGQVLAYAQDLPQEAQGVRSGVVAGSGGEPVYIYEGQRVLVYQGRVVNPGDSLVRGTPEDFFVFALEEEQIARAAAGETVIAPDFAYGVSGTPPTRVGYIPLKLGGTDDAVLAVLLRQSDLFRFEREMVNNVTRVFALLALLALGALALFVRGSISRPLARLQAAAEQMAGGSYAHRAHIWAQDEIGRLASAFNEMAATVQKREADLQDLADSLEEKVQMRTRELTEAVRRLQEESNRRRVVEEQLLQLNEELEQRVAERTAALEAANRHLTVLSRIKDEFISNVSHELRTPISSIKLYHSLLERNPERRATYMERLRRETNRLARIIEDLLLLSRLDQNRVDMVPTALSLNKLVTEYVTDRTPLAQARSLVLNVALEPGIPLVQADEGLIGQVLSILLTNALNYTPPGGSITVSTRTAEHEGRRWAGFTVKDTGPGIPKDEQEMLFSRFWRGKSGHETGAPGTGLGLAIAQEIVARHQGRIEVASEGVPGKGASFTVWLALEEIGETADL
ncbi:MAG: hypothetical protein Kow00124_25020 [Anaerolineae bacterium]